MKRLVFFIFLLVALYAAKPLWEAPVSKYVDLSFLDPIDEKIDSTINKDRLEGTVETFREKVGEAIDFISAKSANMEAAVPKRVPKPALGKPVHSPISIHNIEIGASKEDVAAELGEPKTQSMNEYGTDWFTYHEDYQNFTMVAYDTNGKVGALYTNDDLIASSDGIAYGTPKADVREALGTPLTEMRKGLNIYVLQKDEGMDVFKTGNVYTFVFYDLHEGTKVTALLLVSADLERRKSDLYAEANSALRLGFEQQLFDLTNAARVRHGRSILKWNDEVAETARNHSIDMADNDYFSHDNLKGQSPFDRMKVDHIPFRRAGENLAYGQSSSIFAHEGLMNSKGHRENILIRDYSHLGIGVAFNEESTPYFTENFFSQ